MMRNVFELLEIGVDSIHTNSWNIKFIKYLSDFNIPFQGHVGFVPMKSTWTGGVKPFGKKSKEAVKIFNDIKELENSEIVKSHDNCDKIQDPYSIRCIPHVHGASRDIFDNVEKIINNELNSISDNPLVFPNGKIMNSGHFHAEHISQALDTLSIAMSEIGAIAERRINYFMKGIGDRIPMFGAINPGLESGFMLAQVTAASLASENKTLAHPASVDSISTSESIALEFPSASMNSSFLK